MGRFHKTYAVFAMLRDKDIAGVARALRPKVDVWLVAGIDAPRGASADEVVHALEAAGVIPGTASGRGSARAEDRSGKRNHTLLSALLPWLMPMPVSRRPEMIEFAFLARSIP